MAGAYDFLRAAARRTFDLELDERQLTPNSEETGGETIAAATATSTVTPGLEAPSPFGWALEEAEKARDDAFTALKSMAHGKVDPATFVRRKGIDQALKRPATAPRTSHHSQYTATVLKTADRGAHRASTDVSDAPSRLRWEAAAPRWKAGVLPSSGETHHKHTENRVRPSTAAPKRSQRAPKFPLAVSGARVSQGGKSHASAVPSRRHLAPTRLSSKQPTMRAAAHGWLLSPPGTVPASQPARPVMTPQLLALHAEQDRQRNARQRGAHSDLAGSLRSRPSTAAVRSGSGQCHKEIDDMDRQASASLAIGVRTGVTRSSMRSRSRSRSRSSRVRVRVGGGSGGGNGGRLAAVEARVRGNRKELGAERRRLAQETERVLRRSAVAAAGADKALMRMGERSLTAADTHKSSYGGIETSHDGLSAWGERSSDSIEAQTSAMRMVEGEEVDDGRRTKSSVTAGKALSPTATTSTSTTTEEEIRREIAQLRAEAAEHVARAEALQQGKPGPATTMERREAHVELDSAANMLDAQGWVRGAAAAAGVDAASLSKQSIFRRPVLGERKSHLSQSDPESGHWTPDSLGIRRPVESGAENASPRITAVIAGLTSPSSQESPPASDWEQRVTAWTGGPEPRVDAADSFDAMAAALLDRLHEAASIRQEDVSE